MPSRLGAQRPWPLLEFWHRNLHQSKPESSFCCTEAMETALPSNPPPKCYHLCLKHRLLGDFLACKHDPVVHLRHLNPSTNTYRCLHTFTPFLSFLTPSPRKKEGTQGVSSPRAPFAWSPSHWFLSFSFPWSMPSCGLLYLPVAFISFPANGLIPPVWPGNQVYLSPIRPSPREPN